MKGSVVVVELERLFLSFQARGQCDGITPIAPPFSVWSPFVPCTWIRPVGGMLILEAVVVCLHALDYAPCGQ